MAEAVDNNIPNGIQVTAKWEWTTSNAAGRWSNPQQGIKPKRVHGPTNSAVPNDDGHGVWFSKLKIRGHGKSLVVRYESEDGKDFHILGWAIPFTADTVA